MTLQSYIRLWLVIPVVTPESDTTPAGDLLLRSSIIPAVNRAKTRYIIRGMFIDSKEAVFEAQPLRIVDTNEALASALTELASQPIPGEIMASAVQVVTVNHPNVLGVALHEAMIQGHAVTAYMGKTSSTVFYDLFNMVWPTAIMTSEIRDSLKIDDLMRGIMPAGKKTLSVDELTINLVEFFKVWRQLPRLR